MKFNKINSKDIKSLIAVFIVISMLLLPLGAFAGSGDASDGSDTLTTTTGSPDDSNTSGSSDSGDSGSTETTDSSNDGGESSPGSDRDSESSDDEAGKDDESADDGTVEINTTGTEDEEENEPGAAEEGDKKESTFDDQVSENDQELTAENADGTGTEEKGDKVVDEESDAPETGTDTVKDDEEATVTPILKSNSESDSQKQGSDDEKESETPFSGDDDEQGAEEPNSDGYEDQKFDGNTYSAVIKHIEEHADYDSDYAKHLGLDELRYFEATITEIGQSRIGSVQITVPEGFDLKNEDFSWSFSSFDSNAFAAGEYKDNWDGSIDEDTGTVSLWAKAVDYYLYFGESVTALFKAKTPAVISPEAEDRTKGELPGYDENGDYKIGIYDFELSVWTNATTDELDAGGIRIPLYEDGSNAGDGTGVGVSNDRLNTISEDHSLTMVWVGDDDFHEALEAATGYNVIDSADNHQGQSSYSVVLKSVVDGSPSTFNFEITHDKGSAGQSAQAMEELWIILPAGFAADAGSISNLAVQYDDNGDITTDSIEFDFANGRIVWKGNLGEPKITVFNISFNATVGPDSGNVFQTEALWFPNANTSNNVPNLHASEEPAEVAFPIFSSQSLPSEPVDDEGFEEDLSPTGDENGGDDNNIIPGDEPVDDPDDPVTGTPGLTAAPLGAPAAPAAVPGAAPEDAPAAPVEVPAEAAAEEAPVSITEDFPPEAPQVEPVAEAEAGSFNFWPLLLILIPALLWFLWARLVLVRVPNEKGEYRTVARKLARRKDKRWFVDVEKQLQEYLEKHREVLVDFRGGLIKDAKKAVYSGETTLSEGEKRFALINSRSFVNWVDELKERTERIAG